MCEPVFAGTNLVMYPSESLKVGYRRFRFKKSNHFEPEIKKLFIKLTGVHMKNFGALTAGLLSFLTSFAALANGQFIFSDPDAVKICKSQRMDFDKGVCLGVIEDKHFDKSVIDICENQSMDINKTVCLRWIANKRYLSKEKISYIRETVTPDSEKLLWLRFGTKSAPLE
jgi:hypothetical protein